MANTINAAVATYFDNGNTSPQYCTNNTYGASSLVKLSGGMVRYQAGISNQAMAQIGYMYFPQNQKTAFPSLPGKTKYPRFP
jgi:hypothetical protein